ncbi:ABC transporter permease subunit [Fodinibius halophilus]|uniref:Sugar ABC transporter permease n=1 Tax=Fodinibius halophilus TaxID=1736908 RepID=A0A6M1T688_9BACT|nr:ABC transporter permease subunit [Fodinibius halophilus]NGP88815.1 sugar ABC transporter permease [Fodinibius halophilus]
MKISELTLFNNKAETAGIGLFLLLAVLPLVLGVLYALLYSLGLIGLISDGFTFSHWQRALSDQEFWLSILYTFYIALTTIAISITSALAASLYINKPLQKGIAGFSAYIPLAFPAIVVAFLAFQLGSQSGFFARLFFQFGIITDTAAFPEMVNDPFGIGIIAAHTFMAMPFFTLYFMSLYDQENISELSQVAQTLGASRTAQLRRIIVPIILKRAFPTLTLYTIFVMGSYEIPLILGRQTPQMMSVLVIRKLRRFSLSTIPEAYITALVFIAIILTILYLLFKSRTFSYDLDR